MSSFRFLSDARCHLAEILDYIEEGSGLPRSERVESEVLRIVELLAEHPRAGHRRRDITKRDVLFWSVYSYLVVYRPETKPLELLRVLHGSRNPLDLCGEVGERPDRAQAYSTRPLDFPIRGSNARDEPNHEAMSVSCAGEVRRNEAWREDVRRKIDEGFEQSERGEMFDGEAVFERHRRLIESWKD